MSDRLAVWSRFIEGLTAGGAVPEVILDSWRRSEAAGVDREQVRFHRISGADLEARLAANAQWLDAATPHVDWLSKACRQSSHVVYLTDRDGIVLYSAGDPAMMETFALWPGYDWSEARMGTNGAGTALAVDCPIAVVGPQHFVGAFNDCTCTGAPIHGPDGSVVGALDISSPVAGVTPERLFIVSHAAYAISRSLALRESEARHDATRARLLAALAASDAGTFCWDSGSGRFVEFDDSLKRLFGFHSDEPVTTTADLLGRVHQTDRARVARAFEGCRAGEDFEMEFRVLLPDGSVRWLFNRAKLGSPVGDGGAHLVGACIDITERKHTEEALATSHRQAAESEGRLAMALDVAALGVWEFDPVVEQIRGDVRWAEMLGIPSDRALSLEEYTGALLPEDRAGFEQLLQRSEGAGGRFVAEHRVCRPDGSCRWLAVRGCAMRSPAADAARCRYLGTVMDVTEQREAEKLLAEAYGRERQANALLDAIFSAAPIGIGFWDRDLRFQRLNPVLAEINGLPLEAHLGKRPDELLPDIEGLDGILAQWRRVVETGEPLLNVEVRGRTQAPSDRERIWLEHFFPVRVGDRVIGLGAVIDDVSERRRTEEALRDADRAKDEFLAVLGHELRNPLAPLRTGLDLLDHVPAKPQLLETIRPMMDRQLSHLVRLVDDLLDISRISRGKIELQRAPLDLNAPIEAAVEQMRPLMAQRRHEFVVELAETSVTVAGDFERLTQVLANLLSNAAKYTEPGGRVSVRSALEGGQAVVRVKDNGYGIPPGGFDKLFKLFSQIPEHHARTGGGGLGIGLALARQLIRMHGGTIGAASDGVGRGSEFIVRLPVAAPEQRLAALAGAGAESTPVRRVLVVDDNVDAAESLRMLLELQGQVVRVVPDGPAALDEMPRFAPQVVLLDLGLPGMDGIEVARRLRRLPAQEDVLVVAVTGWGQDEDRRRTREAGFDAHLTKPIDWAHLAPLFQLSAATESSTG